MKKFNANGGQRRSKSFRVSVSKDLISDIRNTVWRDRAIVELGFSVVSRLEAEYPDRVWDAGAIEYLKKALRK